MTAVVRGARVGVGVNGAGPSAVGVSSVGVRVGRSRGAGVRVVGVADVWTARSTVSGAAPVEVGEGQSRTGQAPVGWSSSVRRCLLANDLPSGYAVSGVWVARLGSEVAVEGRRTSLGGGLSGVSGADGCDDVRTGVADNDLSALGARWGAAFDAVSSVVLMVLVAISAVVVAVVVVGVMAGYIA